MSERYRILESEVRWLNRTTIEIELFFSEPVLP